jgi:hypothetical protein
VHGVRDVWFLGNHPLHLSIAARLRVGVTPGRLTPASTQIPVVSAVIRAHLPRFRTAAWHRLLAGLQGDHHFARHGTYLRTLRGQRESADVVGVGASDLEQRVVLVFNRTATPR